MATDTTEGGTKPLSPDEAFGVLGNETRMEILHALGESDQPESFSHLRDRVGVRDSGQFNYHLDQLTDHFVRRTDDGYELRQAGRRVVMAVMSGAVTEAPVMEPTRIGVPCTYCGADVEVSYREERLAYHCTECAGAYGDASRETLAPPEHGFLGFVPFPPAGLQRRTAEEAHLAAMGWGHLDLLASASGICPHCAAVLERSIDVCESHDFSGELCAACDRRHAVKLQSRCTNCIVEMQGMFVNGLLARTEVLAFLTTHGINLIAPTSNPWAALDFEEEVLSTDPFEARYIFSVEDDSLVLTVDEELSVTDVTDRSAAPSE